MNRLRSLSSKGKAGNGLPPRGPPRTASTPIPPTQSPAVGSSPTIIVSSSPDIVSSSAPAGSSAGATAETTSVDEQDDYGNEVKDEVDVTITPPENWTQQAEWNGEQVSFTLNYKNLNAPLAQGTWYPLDWMEYELSRIILPGDMPTRHVLRKFWWAADGKLDVMGQMLEEALWWHRRMNNNTSYNNGFRFPPCFQNLAYITVHRGRKDNSESQYRSRPVIPVIWYKWGLSNNLKKVFAHNNGQTVLGWHFHLIEQAMARLRLHEVNDEPWLEDKDYRKIFVVHDLQDYNSRSKHGDGLLWPHLYDLKFITDAFYPSCFHREVYFFVEAGRRQLLDKSDTNPSWLYFSDNMKAAFLHKLPPLDSTLAWPLDYLPETTDSEERERRLRLCADLKDRHEHTAPIEQQGQGNPAPGGAADGGIDSQMEVLPSVMSWPRRILKEKVYYKRERRMRSNKEFLTWLKDKRIR
ncbi:hypothetical protein QBC43DRAFT_302977 [Cladorrhinum sp. PSN259]|nr:hypothetical protein QBC43DRAFT_302977 [Cladorrhinum sp. PSN259]